MLLHSYYIVCTLLLWAFDMFPECGWAGECDLLDQPRPGGMQGASQFQFLRSENQRTEATVQQERLVSTGKFKDSRLPAWGIGIQQQRASVWTASAEPVFYILDTPWNTAASLYWMRFMADSLWRKVFRFDFDLFRVLHGEDVQRNSITMARMLSPEFFLVVWSGFLAELRRWTWCWTTMALETRRILLAIWERCCQWSPQSTYNCHVVVRGSTCL